MEAIYPRLLIAAPQGRSGKTTFSLGLCSILNQQGYKIQPFKKGPDYIDPSWLSAASGNRCRTLDPFFQNSDDELMSAFINGAKDADLAVIEGNHGLFDSVSQDGFGSSAAVARTLRAPIILVVNTARMGRSAAAMISGYQTFEPETPIKAVVLNNVAGNRHEAKMRSAIESHCDVPVAGAIPRNDAVKIPDRHLGLIPYAEDSSLVPAIEACRRVVERFIDIDLVFEIARASEPIPASWTPPSGRSFQFGGLGPTIGVIQDKAFTFYYPENFEALEKAGGSLVFIDALRDTTLPHVDALYIGGGFPEIFMFELEANHDLREAIRSKIELGLPVYAECGGLMYLGERIHLGDRSAKMVGAMPFEVALSKQPQGHGYVMAEVNGENPFLPIGAILRGHEFHNSTIINLNSGIPTAFQLGRGSGLGNQKDGLVYQNVLASYTHLHAHGTPNWAAGVVSRAWQFALEQENA